MRALRAAWLVPSAVALLACGEGVLDRGVLTAWEGELQPAGASSRISGSVAAISEGLHTRASIQITRATPAAVYLWRLRDGTCPEPGDLVGGLASYPELMASGTGEADAEALLSERMPAGSPHHARLLRQADSSLVACAELVQR